MQQASDRQDYEKAAEYRDRIKALTLVQSKQGINVSGIGEADIFGLYKRKGGICIQVFFFRGGQNFGNRAYFPKYSKDDLTEDVLEAFMAQFYENKPVPKEIIISHKIKSKKLLEEAFTSKNKGTFKTKILVPLKGVKKDIIEFALQNAKDSLQREQLKILSENKSLSLTAELFEIRQKIKRIEVYDNSHISGTNMVGAMIVSGPAGFVKNAYRKFNIKQSDKADDYGMMREVIRRRFKNIEKELGSENWPDLLLVDGGKGQLSSVLSELEEMGIKDKLNVVAIAKGPDRDAGREKFFIDGQDMFQLPVNDPVLHYLQRLRDEAHRFAIGAHRTRRKKDISKSLLDDVPGIGAKRKKALLNHFGSSKSVASAGVKDLQKVEGVSKATAQRIYDYFHE
jgi:excinuclease ABC subunit C